ncbi:hypothetical protein ACRTJ2_005217, partial [Escherichia coli]
MSGYKCRIFCLVAFKSGAVKSRGNPAFCISSRGVSDLCRPDPRPVQISIKGIVLLLHFLRLNK